MSEMSETGGIDSGPAKKLKLEENGSESERRRNPEPSKVVHVRQLSSQAIDADLLEALQTFGPIAYSTVFPHKHMGLVEFENIEAAKKCVEFAKTTSIFVAGQESFFNYSTSKSIQRFGLESETPNHVLVLSIDNARYPINVEVLHEICKTHGEVRRIAIIRKPQHLQALVEFDSINSARAAKAALNGADIYSGCCTLKLEFAKPDTVRVDANTEDQWDYTGRTFAQAPPPRTEARKTLLNGPQGGPATAPYSNSQGGYSGGGGRPPNPNYGMGRNYYDYSQCPGGAPGDGLGGGGRRSIMNNPSGPPSMGMGGGGGYNRGPAPYGGSGGGYYNNGGANYPSAQDANFYRGGGGHFDSHDQGSPVVAMLYGIDHENWNCDKIFNLLCIYGDVYKIRLMKTKSDTAMLEFANQTQMRQAIDFIFGIYVFGNKLSLRPSKQTHLQPVFEPFPLSDGSPSYKEYTDSRNLRFLNPGSAAKNRLVKPSSVVHFFNCPPDLNEEKITEVFEVNDAPCPTKVTIFATRSERSLSGLVEFEDLDQAAQAIMKVNHTELPSPSGRKPYVLKLAFADKSRREHSSDY